MYEISADTVLRRYRDPHKSALLEAEVMRFARERGVPVPEVRDADGPDLTMQRLVGATMAAALARRPWQLRRGARRLATLHRQVHAVAAPEGLRQVGDGDALLHLDLHPENVVLTADGPFIIDWSNAAAGPPELDVADAWLVLSVAEMTGGPVRRQVIGALARRLAASFVRASEVDHLSQLNAAALRRLGDRNIGPAERSRIEQLVAKHAS